MGELLEVGTPATVHRLMAGYPILDHLQDLLGPALGFALGWPAQLPFLPRLQFSLPALSPAFICLADNLFCLKKVRLDGMNLPGPGPASPVLVRFPPHPHHQPLAVPWCQVMDHHMSLWSPR